MYQQYRNLLSRRGERSAAEGSNPVTTSLEVIKRWLTGAAQRLQVSKNREGTRLRSKEISSRDQEEA